MNITDIFVRRPVLASVVSIFILVLGLRAMSLLGVRQYPATQNAVVTVTTVYTGADPALVAGFISTPLENAVAQANGIDYLTSSSAQSVSIIKANLLLNYDVNKALTEISTKISSVLNQLPREAQQPSISVSVGESLDSMYIGFYSKTLPANKISDYLVRVVQPKLQTVTGVQTAEILGNKQFALRAWLNPQQMASLGVTPADVTQALAANDYIAAVGRTQGQMVTVDLTADTGIKSTEAFKNLVLRSQGNAIVRLKDVAHVTLGSENYDETVTFDGENAVFIGIKVAPGANVLTVIEGVRKAFPAVAAQLPQGLEGRIVYDTTEYIESSIHEVNKTLVEALIIVTVVIFLFLGSLRSVLIPAVAMPLSLIGAFFLMLIFGYTINLLTLLALVLAIGLVVDDAIIMVENIHRHIENGLTPFDAALQGARELAGPIIAISVVLIAVYVPVGFMGGLTGALFTEFAFTLTGAVGVSAIVALTLSPVMCALFLKPTLVADKESFATKVDHIFNGVRLGYERFLRGVLNNLPVVLVFALIVLTANFFLYKAAKSELAPVEDPGFILSFYSAAPNASLAQTRLYSGEIQKIFATFPETAHTFQLDGMGGLSSGMAGLVLKPWDQRKRLSQTVSEELQQKLAGLSGLNAVAFLPPALPGGGEGLPVQFVIGTTDSFERLDEMSQALLLKARQSGVFMFADTDLKFNKPQVEIVVDRDKAAQMGLTMQEIGGALGTMLGGGYINYFSLAGRSYKVIPQVAQRERLNAEQLKNFHVRTATGKLISLGTLVHLKKKVVPQSLNHFQQLNAATISGVPMPGLTQGQVLAKLQAIAKEILPGGYTVDYSGASRQFVKESSAIVVTFFFALVVIFLVLAAQFESFRDPLIVLVSVPLSICGAMIFISLGVGGASLNIYTQVGLVTLVGLITKHGILIVEFANELQREGKTKREAVLLAAGIRLRPILMTTASTVLGVLPLVMASGAGAAGRFSMGLVIMTGISIGTLFTIFMVPAMYMLLAADHARRKHV